jgi:hypothetical protein
MLGNFFQGCNDIGCDEIDLIISFVLVLVPLRVNMLILVLVMAHSIALSVLSIADILSLPIRKSWYYSI